MDDDASVVSSSDVSPVSKSGSVTHVEWTGPLAPSVRDASAVSEYTARVYTN